jgi:hypothetical protein
MICLSQKLMKNVFVLTNLETHDSGLRNIRIKPQQRKDKNWGWPLRNLEKFCKMS